MIDCVVLQGFDQAQEVVRFGDEDSLFVEKEQNTFDDLMDVFDVGKDIGGGDDGCGALFVEELAGHFSVKETEFCFDAALIGQVCHIAWLNSANPLAPFVEITEKGSVV